ncbi:hypothetical protein VNI00_010215 [Paramarasmius palmivorus]|uniref:BTB domain-containing protein n=1 Tax=Paramarasmius palmivorus TaxID=297713 RepID=A0AAW0BWK3_9AGAR
MSSRRMHHPYRHHIQILRRPNLWCPHTKPRILRYQIPLPVPRVKSELQKITLTETTESAEVLKLLLIFTHNSPSPDLCEFDVEVVVSLAEAAYSYGNNFALAACKKAMRLLADQSPQHALRFLKFKADRDDREDIDYIAEKTVSLPIVDVLNFFGCDFDGFRIWLLYQQAYTERSTHYSNAVMNGFPAAHHVAPVGMGGGTNIVCPSAGNFKNALCSVLSKLKVRKNELPTPEVFRQAMAICATVIPWPCAPVCGLGVWSAYVQDALVKPPKWSDFARDERNS